MENTARCYRCGELVYYEVDEDGGIIEGDCPFCYNLPSDCIAMFDLQIKNLSYVNISCLVCLIKYMYKKIRELDGK